MSTEDIKRYIKVLKETKSPLNEDCDCDDVVNPNETKVEVEFKDNDQIEVEVKATGVDELKRLMDLAGVFHKDKQATAGQMTHISGPEVGGPDNLPVPVEPAPVDAEVPGAAATDTDMEPEAGVEPEIGVEPEALPTGGPNVPAEVNPEDDTEAPEMDFDMDMASEDEMFEDDDFEGLDEADEASAGKRFDYGEPNPNLGQESYDIEAASFSGGASKPVRFVPARSGDNPMVDAIDQKGLREYIEEITQEKKEISEVNPQKIDTIAKTVSQNLPQAEQQRIKTAAANMAQKAKMKPMQFKDKNAQQVALDIAASDEANLSDPEQQKILRTASTLGKEFDEGRRKRTWTFRQEALPFQGLTGVQRVRRAALRRSKSTLRSK